MSEYIGALLKDRYRIVTQIGRGGMGRVFLAYDRETGKPVAIKVIRHPTRGDSNPLRDRLHRESAALARLRHPNIVSLLDMVEQDEESFLVLKYVEGMHLGTFLDKRPDRRLTLEETLPIVRQIVCALQFAHEQGIYYRDLKPQNVLIDSTGKVYLVDFGTALVTDLTRLTRSSEFVGTFAYAAPEQWATEQEIAAPTDVYGLGMLLYELLTGQLPFGTDVQTLMHKVFNEMPTPPRELNDQISYDVESVIYTALAKHKEERYPDMLAMLSDLERAAKVEVQFAALLEPVPSEPGLETASKPVPEPTPEPGPGPPPTHTRWRGWWIASLAANLVLLALVAWALWSRFGTDEARDGEQAVIATATPTALPTATASATASPTWTLTATPRPTATQTATNVPTPITAATPTPSPISAYREPYVLPDAIDILKGPGPEYELLAAGKRGDRLYVTGRTRDGKWWRVDRLGQEGWIPAPLGGSLNPPTVTPPTPPPPTATPTKTPKPTLQAKVELVNAGFAGVETDYVPGWQWWAYDNFDPDKHTYDPLIHYDTPSLKQADDPERFIEGDTLQIDAVGHRKFRVYIFQRVKVPARAVLRLQASAGAYSDNGGIDVAAGIDPNGGPNCDQAVWSSNVYLDQTMPARQIASRGVSTGNSTWATVCLRAETRLSARSNAAFFDSAELLVDER